MTVAPVLQDPTLLGKTIAAARGWRGDHRPAFAKRLGTSVPTLNRWEAGDFSSHYRTTEQRRQLAERVVAASGCPPEWFGLAESPADVRGLVAEHEEILRLLLEHLELQDEAELARLSADVDRLFGSSTRTSEGSGPAVSSP